jgi:hypothetical protein
MIRPSILVGLTLLFAGSAIILSILFHIEIPLWRLLFAGVLVYAGLALLFRYFRGDPNQHLAMGSFEIVPQSGHTQAKSTRILFGQGIIDISSFTPTHNDMELSLEMLLARVVIRFHPDIPLFVDVTSLLADCRLPDGNHLVLGQMEVRPKTTKTPCIRLKLTTTLASVRFASYVAGEDDIGLSIVVSTPGA